MTCLEDEYCKRGKCIYSDINQNHLHDRAETSVNQGKPCRRHEECDSFKGRGDGFCDSALGYQCSTRCTDDSQCVDDITYHYICRSDGRCAPDSFITIWRIPESSPTLTLLNQECRDCTFAISWGDGSTDNAVSIGLSKLIKHTYAKGGDYVVTIKGRHFRFGWPPASENIDKDPEDPTTDGSPAKLIEVRTFGPARLSSHAFAYCENLSKLSAVDIPDATSLNLRYAFYRAAAFNAPLDHWDVSQVTDLASAFHNAASFNQPLDHWDTSRVTTMNRTFSGATQFNGALDTWDVSQVTDMKAMFNDAAHFDKPVERWNTSNVTDMFGMFFGATAFNQPLAEWKTNKVTDMSGMFANAMNFNQPIETWNTSNVTTMFAMFSHAESFNQPLEAWDTSHVTNMYGMFSSAKKFNQPLAAWNTSHVTTMKQMFESAFSFNQPLASWDVSHVTDMYRMFYSALAYDQNLSSWLVSSGTKVDDMFKMCGMSTENLCRVYQSSTWQNKSNLGKSDNSCKER